MDHELERTLDMVFMCKKCKKAFRKEVNEFEEADEYCPHCDNHFMPEDKTPETEGKLVFEFEMEKGHETKMVQDDREKQHKKALDFSNYSEDDFKHDLGELDDC